MARAPGELFLDSRDIQAIFIDGVLILPNRLLGFILFLFEGSELLLQLLLKILKHIKLPLLSHAANIFELLFQLELLLFDLVLLVCKLLPLLIKRPQLLSHLHQVFFLRFDLFPITLRIIILGKLVNLGLQSANSSYQGVMLGDFLVELSQLACNTLSLLV